MRTKLLIKIVFLFAIIIITTISIANISFSASLDFDENGVDDLKETGWFVYPKLAGFYDVEDWEVSVCLNVIYEDESPKELNSVLAGAMLREYPGQVDSISASVKKDVPLPEDITKKTNLYTVCWGIVPFENNGMKFSVILKGDEKLVIAENQEAPGKTPVGDCKAVYSDLKFTKAYITTGVGPLPPAPVIDEDEGEEVNWG